MGPDNEALCDYSVFDGYRAGYRTFVFVIRDEVRAEFAAHHARVWGGALDIRLATQAAPPLPRRRPWGTGHAVLAARDHLVGACAVVNADDWYPARGYDQVAQAVGGGRANEHALVAYRLDSTPMSTVGGVSRAVCEVDRDGYLYTMQEIRDITPSGAGYVGHSLEGAPVALSGSEPVCMNLWGFAPGIFAVLEHQFGRFATNHAGDSEAEFMIGDAINGELRAGTCRVRVLDGGGGGFGMTYEQDLRTVSKKIDALIATGRYPVDLRDGLI